MKNLIYGFAMLVTLAACKNGLSKAPTALGEINVNHHASLCPRWQGAFMGTNSRQQKRISVTPDVTGKLVLRDGSDFWVLTGTPEPMGNHSGASYTAACVSAGQLSDGTTSSEIAIQAYDGGQKIFHADYVKLATGNGFEYSVTNQDTTVNVPVDSYTAK
jgi:hypothetical protein